MEDYKYPQQTCRLLQMSRVRLPLQTLLPQLVKELTFEQHFVMKDKRKTVSLYIYPFILLDLFVTTVPEMTLLQNL